MAEATEVVEAAMAVVMVVVDMEAAEAEDGAVSEVRNITSQR